MKTNLDCIPCFTRHTLEAARTLNLNDADAAQLMIDVIKLILRLDWQQPPPVMARDIHRLIKTQTGNSDPYAPHKQHTTQTALKLLPDIQRIVREAKQPFKMAVRFAIAGNAIDLGAKTMNQIDISAIFKSAQHAPLDDTAVNRLEAQINAARNILFLADNAGEVVFDLPLLEWIGPQKVTVVVRGEPVINDAVMEDARRAGICERFKVISNGADTPGTWLADCSPEFVRAFSAADLVIAKGQGNYETLNDAAHNLFFLFMAKCPVIAEDAGVPLQSYVVIDTLSRQNQKMNETYPRQNVSR
ncbi:MAG: DUF89 family protein [Deltaproteobacteria bacterium]|nr:DUF89 family protein [Deltaproteobacteria bacterium]